MSETTMIEKVARALCCENGQNPDHDIGFGLKRWQTYKLDARAAIEAMHEPTDAMAEAAYQAVEMSDAWCIEDDTHWKRSFRASISAALADVPPSPTESHP